MAFRAARGWGRGLGLSGPSNLPATPVRLRPRFRQCCATVATASLWWLSRGLGGGVPATRPTEMSPAPHHTCTRGYNHRLLSCRQDSWRWCARSLITARLLLSAADLGGVRRCVTVGAGARVGTCKVGRPAVAAPRPGRRWLTGIQTEYGSQHRGCPVLSSSCCATPNRPHLPP